MSEQPMRPENKQEAAEAARHEVERLAQEEERRRAEAGQAAGENPLAGMNDQDVDEGVDDLFGNLEHKAA